MSTASLAECLSISEAAALVGVPPKRLSDLLFAGALECPRVGNRHVVPRDYLPTLRMVLAQRQRQRPAPPAAAN